MNNNLKNEFIEIFKNDIEKITDYINKKSGSWIYYKKIDFNSKVPKDYFENLSEYSILFNFIKLKLLSQKYQIKKIYKASKFFSPDFVILVEKNNFYEYIGLEVTQYKDITGLNSKNLIPIDISKIKNCIQCKKNIKSLTKHYLKISTYEDNIKSFFNSNKVNCYLVIDVMFPITDSIIYLDCLENFVRNNICQKVFISFMFPNKTSSLYEFNFIGKYSFLHISDFLNSDLYKEYYQFVKHQNYE